MTADEWDQCRQFQSMFRAIRGIKSGLKPRTRVRKYRLFGSACLRSVWDKLPENCFRTAVATAEELADSNCTEREVEWAKSGVANTMHWLESEFADPCLTLLGKQATRMAWMFEYSWPFQNFVSVGFLRDVFGNPFRKVMFDPRWRSESAVSLARAAYESRNFTLLPVLADALEEAGCDHPDILTHCRGPGPHVRGCWVVDLVLGKS